MTQTTAQRNARQRVEALSPLFMRYYAGAPPVSDLENRKQPGLGQAQIGVGPRNNT